MSSPTPGYLKIFNPEKGACQPVIIRAGAGAGKTTELISRVISFGVEYKKKHQVWPTLVVTTFTVKATQELRERLIKVVINAQKQEVFYAQSEILDWVQSPMIFITTIHSLVIRYLREYGSFIGLKSDFEIDELPEQKFKIFIKQHYFTNEDFKNQLAPWLVDWTWSELLMMLRSACLARLKNGKPLDYLTAQSQLDIFKKNKAHILLLVVKLVENLSTEKLTTEKRKLAFEYLSEVIRQSDFEALDFINQLSRVTFSCDTANEQLKKIKDLLKELIRPQWNISYLQEIEEDNKKFLALSEVVFFKWIESRVTSQCLSLDEIELFGNYLIDSFPATAKKFSESWTYWYVDEYQDTSPQQVKILDALMGDRFGFFVGDPQQSIYLFRGARPQVFQERWEQFNNIANAKQIIFDTNYRTHPQVLNFINQVVTSKSSSFSEMKSGEDAVSLDSYGVELIEFESQNNSQQMRYQASLRVLQVVIQKISQGFSLGQIAILARKRSELKQLAYILRLNNLNFQLHVGGAFYRRREIIDALSILRFIIQPDDMKNIINILKFNRVPGTLLQVNSQKLWSEIRDEFKNCPLVEILQGWLDLQSQIGILKAWIKAIKDIRLFDYFFIEDPTGQKESNLFKLIQTVYEEQFNSHGNWHKFYWNFMNQFESGGDEADAVADLDPHRIQLMTVHGSKGLEFDCVIYLHMPQKGQINNFQNRFYFSEHHRCFTIGKEWWVEESEEWKVLFPTIYEIDHKRQRDWEKQEADRVVYVALTRTKRNLVIVKPQDFQDEWSLAFSNETKFKPLCMPDLSTMPTEINSIVDKQEPFHINPDFYRTNKLGLIPEVKSTSWDNYFKQKKGIESHLLFQQARYHPETLAKSPDLQWAISEWPDLLFGLRNGFSEWGFLYIQGLNKIQGRIDLWWFNDESVFVVDYKTGILLSPDQRWEQLSQYAQAIKKSGYQLPNRFELVIINFRERVILHDFLIL